MYYWYYDIMIYVALSFALTQFNFVLVKQNVDRQSGRRVSLLGIEELQLHPSPGTWHRSPRVEYTARSGWTDLPCSAHQTPHTSNTGAHCTVTCIFETHIKDHIRRIQGSPGGSLTGAFGNLRCMGTILCCTRRPLYQITSCCHLFI